MCQNVQPSIDTRHKTQTFLLLHVVKTSDLSPDFTDIYFTLTKSLSHLILTYQKRVVRFPMESNSVPLPISCHNTKPYDSAFVDDIILGLTKLIEDQFPHFQCYWLWDSVVGMIWGKKRRKKKEKKKPKKQRKQKVTYMFLFSVASLSFLLHNTNISTQFHLHIIECSIVVHNLCIA